MILVGLAAMSIVAACTVTAGDGGAPATPTAAFAGEVPDFDGPYSAEFAEFYRRATSDFVRGALADGQISDAEYAEMTDRFKSCLADQGITFKGFEPDGSLTTSLAPNGGDTHAIVSQCSSSSGEDSIGALHSFMVTNPENTDPDVIMAECLVRNGVVPQGYSADDFSREKTGRFADDESLPDDLREAFSSCISDPLGVLDGGS